jgi:FixJ family two-component response regulator
MLNVATVFLVDSDAKSVELSRQLLESHGLNVLAYDSPREFPIQSATDLLGCVVTELKFPSSNGIDFLCQLKEQGWMVPIIVHTGCGDVSSCARAFRSGATDFLEKSTPPECFLERILSILSACRQNHSNWQSKRTLQMKLSGLTDRERAVLRALISGLAIKEIAGEFGTSFQSVARHRQRILTKLEVENDVALVNLLRGYSSRQTKVESEFDKMLATIHD